eukprot:CAMPEP_0185379212 /NCGR_PEP_ID=MMETSP1364-20130426/47151_1 /TAXON_ID=38817 /ORGANISM="Gephyrocapsa oceanica, Strain RCC1303" /LENGTH=139 /DNA_ID=CAMNT_0027980787 /DNA_START=24 /DNA_END=443 /DNA_ORIENTATION=-
MVAASFSDEGGGVVLCAAPNLAEREVYERFKQEQGEAIQALADDAKLLFRVTVDDNTPLKPGQSHALVYAGVAHTARLSRLLEVFNARYCKGEGQEGAFLLSSGYAIKPNASCGGVFMRHGDSITFHSVVDFTRLAYAS